GRGRAPTTTQRPGKRARPAASCQSKRKTRRAREREWLRASLRQVWLERITFRRFQSRHRRRLASASSDPFGSTGATVCECSRGHRRGKRPTPGLLFRSKGECLSRLLPGKRAFAFALPTTHTRKRTLPPLCPPLLRPPALA